MVLRLGFMQKFHTRISFVEALRWSDHLDLRVESAPAQNIIVQRDARTFVVTPDGQREIHAGDWLIRDATGSFIPMSDEMFRQKYEPAKLPCTAA